MKKLTRNQWPVSHTENDFKCFGPPATQDGKFDDNYLADLGCFKQEKISNNKYVHAAVVQSIKTQDWFFYTEWGRVGSSPAFQFYSCGSKEEAHGLYRKHLHKKNDKRGQWVEDKKLGRILKPLYSKDCYLVRPQATRSTGLPDARTIVHGTPIVVDNLNKSSLDKQSAALLKDLKFGTVEYTRGLMTTDALPTQEAIDKARIILNEATKINNITTNVFENRDLNDLTNMIYSLLPKKKSRKMEKAEWWLTPENISVWQSDLDAFESVLQNQSGTTVSMDIPFELEWLSPSSELGRFIYSWLPRATRNKHYNINNINIVNSWKVQRIDYPKFLFTISSVVTDNKENPLHQPVRKDLPQKEIPVFGKSGTWLLFHGTKGTNILGLLQSGFRLPGELSNVPITGAMMGSGIYTSDDWKKSVGYCSINNAYWSRGSGKINNRKAFMLICDVGLGKSFVAPGPKGYLNPPVGYHSIFGKANVSGVLNNEFVIFNKNQINLRYLIEFEV